MKFEDAAKLLDSMGLLYLPTGSRFTVSPPVLDTDADIVVLDPFGLDFGMMGFLRTSKDSDTYGSSNFTTYRSGEVNLIVVNDEETFNLWSLATKVCTAKNLKRKSDRVNLFKYILYGG